MRTNQIKSESVENWIHKQDYYEDNPGNAEIERLVAKLDSLCNGSTKQITLITSAVLGEGKSTLASYIAHSSSRNRKNPTLLIDFDLRRPSLDRHFGVRRSNGVVDILSYRKPLKDCLKKTLVPNLFILTSGRIGEGTPIHLLNSDKLKRFFVEVRSFFDFVIVDAPPTIPVSDPLLLGKVVDTVILVIKAGSTSKHVVQRAIDMFKDVKVEISGIILNNLNNILPYYYDYDYYGYKYYEKAENDH